MGQKDPRGYYRILGVESNADASEIKSAFRRKAMELHPDRNNTNNTTAQFQLLNEAYGVLSNPETRAEYDTMSLNSGAKPSEGGGTVENTPEPVQCSCCGKVTAQPRYVIFFEVKSFILMTRRSARQGIFCSGCAEKEAMRASAITWLLGWWGFPWGPIYSIQAIFTNLFGGKRPKGINARLATHQAWVFAVMGKTHMARAVALDAMELAKTEGAETRGQIQKLLDLLGEGGPGRLKDAWHLLRRPFYVQGAVAAVAFGILASMIWASAPSPGSYAHSPVPNPKPYIPEPPSTNAVSARAKVPERPAYVRPTKAPNGVPWPVSADFVKGYPRIHADGLSQVTVDNSQNDSDVFVKLFSLDGPKAFAVQTFFIPRHGRFTVNNVTAGTYDIRYQDLNTGGRLRSEQFALEERATYQGTQYSDMTLTLYKVRNGNMRTFALGDDEF